jgi:antitoxin component YwqK of YwqJK toxin-antitoxin module
VFKVHILFPRIITSIIYLDSKPLTMALDDIYDKCASSGLLDDITKIMVGYLVEEIKTDTESYTLFDGKKHGVCQEWYSCISIGYQAGDTNQHDNSIVLNSSGGVLNTKQKYICTYSHGKRQGIYEQWHYNGQLEYRCNYSDGKRQGLEESWHANGQLFTMCNYSDGKMHGLSESWDSNGQPMYRRNYSDGKRQGLYLWYDNGDYQKAGIIMGNDCVFNGKHFVL